MEKTKLIEARKNKGYSQEYMAVQLGLDESTYCRRERGQIKITPEEWKKLCVILGVSIEEIYEGDENQVFIYQENSSGICQGNNNTTTYSTVPQFVLESMQKLITKLEEENKHLKDMLRQGKK
jgi:DNA-binding XRE family transcriptional regulator